MELSRTLSAELEIGALCSLIVERLSSLLAPDVCSLLFVNEAKREVYIREAKNLGSVAKFQFAASLDSGLFAEIIRTQKTLWAHHYSARVAREASKHPEGGPFGHRPGPVLVAPLVADLRVQGILVLARKRSRPSFLPQHKALVEILCAQIAQAIDNAWLYGQLRSLNASLESKVASRTKELAEKASVLEDTLRRLSEMQLSYIQREKLASLGQLSAGIAHEINNPLAYAMSNVAVGRERIAKILVADEFRKTKGILSEGAWHGLQSIRPLLDLLSLRSDLAREVSDFEQDCEQVPADQQPALAVEFLTYLKARGLAESAGLLQLRQLDESLGHATEGLERVKRIVGDLRAFAHPDKGQAELVDLDEEIRRTLTLVDHVAKQAQVQLVFSGGMKATYLCHASRMSQVVMNLVVNAIHASNTGSTVEIRTSDAPSGVTVEVRDFGTGIAPEHLDRIFDPFFTTKAVGEGTGLGLSVCYRIVADHGGRIDVQSVIGHGTTFAVRLPPPFARS
jgi:signal transduction histidine kinase